MSYKKENLHSLNKQCDVTYKGEDDKFYDKNGEKVENDDIIKELRAFNKDMLSNVNELIRKGLDPFKNTVQISLKNNTFFRHGQEIDNIIDIHKILKKSEVIQDCRENYILPHLAMNNSGHEEGCNYHKNVFYTKEEFNNIQKEPNGSRKVLLQESVDKQSNFEQYFKTFTEYVTFTVKNCATNGYFMTKFVDYSKENAIRNPNISQFPFKVILFIQTNVRTI